MNFDNFIVMFRWLKFPISFLIGFALMSGFPPWDVSVRAEEGQSSTLPEVNSEQSSTDPVVTPPKKKVIKKRKRRSREKEVDGTRAQSRFKTDTVIKSFYKKSGRNLDVDPD